MSATTTDTPVFLDPPVERMASPAKVCVIPVPFEDTVSYGGGTAHGPAAILDASAQVEFYDEELQAEAFMIGIDTAPAVDFSGVTGAAAIDRIEAATAAVLARGQWPLLLGGEHSMTTGPVRACRAKYPDVAVVQIDAHGDLRNEYQDSPWSHACVMRRIHEMGVPTFGIGLRSICPEEAALIREAKLQRWFAYQIAESDRWIDEVLAATPQRIFLTIDVDGFDPAVIRATGTPEPGGLQWYPTLRFLRRLFAEKTVIGADVVELAPTDADHASSFAVARLVYKLIGYKSQGRW